MKRKSHYDPSKPMSSTNLPPEAIAEMTKNGIYTADISQQQASPDSIKQPEVITNPVTGVLQPAQNVISPVTPDLSSAPITTPSLLTADQAAALDSALAGLDLSKLPTGGVSPLLGLIDIPTPTIGGGAEQKTQQDIDQQNIATAHSLMLAEVSNGTIIAASNGDSAASSLVIAAANKIISGGNISPDVSHILSQQALMLAGNVINAASTPEDVVNAKVSQIIAIQTAVTDNDNKEAALQLALENASSSDAYNSAAMALKEQQNKSDNAALSLAAVQAADPDITAKANALMKSADVTQNTLPTVTTNLFDRLVNYIYNTLYK
jgi:hypothetical protein